MGGKQNRLRGSHKQLQRALCGQAPAAGTFLLPHRKMSTGNRDCLPSTFCVYQALFRAPPAPSLIPNCPGTGILLLSWNLSVLISKMVLKCLSPGLKSASTHHVSFLLLVVKHFDSYPRLSHRIVGGFKWGKWEALPGLGPRLGSHLRELLLLFPTSSSPPVVILLLLLLTATKMQWELPDHRAVLSHGLTVSQVPSPASLSTLQIDLLCHYWLGEQVECWHW